MPVDGTNPVDGINMLVMALNGKAMPDSKKDTINTDITMVSNLT